MGPATCPRGAEGGWDRWVPSTGCRMGWWVPVRAPRSRPPPPASRLAVTQPTPAQPHERSGTGRASHPAGAWPPAPHGTPAAPAGADATAALREPKSPPRSRVPGTVPGQCRICSAARRPEKAYGGDGGIPRLCQAGVQGRGPLHGEGGPGTQGVAGDSSGGQWAAPWLGGSLKAK